MHVSLRDRATTPGERALMMALLVLPWVQPWAPSPLSNTVPLLISWGCLAIVLCRGRMPSAQELAQGWAIAAVMSAVIGLLQYFGHAAILGGWVHVPGYLGDAVGNLRQRNQLATHLGIGMVAVLWWQQQGLHRRHALWMLALLATADAATGSRTGLLQVLLVPALAAVWWLWWYSQRRDPEGRDITEPAKTWPAHSAGLQTCPASTRGPGWPAWWLMAWTLAIYLLATLALPRLLAWHTGGAVSTALARMGEMSGCGSRSVLWSNVLHLIAQQPWTGWGWGELKYAHYITDDPGERFCDILGNAHNLPLHLAVELGIPVAAAGCLTVLALLWRARPWRLKQGSDALAWSVLAMIGLHSLLEYPLWYGPFQLAALACVLLLWPRAQSALAGHRPMVELCGAALLLALALIAFDYQRMRQVYLPASQRWALWQADPWGAARSSVLFADTVAFADFTVHANDRDAQDAQQTLTQGLALLHYSPEPGIVREVIRAAEQLGQHDLAELHRQRLARAFPAEASH